MGPRYNWTENKANILKKSLQKKVFGWTFLVLGLASIQIYV